MSCPISNVATSMEPGELSHGASIGLDLRKGLEGIFLVLTGFIGPSI
jgi:hypothetical protein